MDKLEKTYKEKLYSLESEVNDQVWDNIANALNKQKKDKRILALIIFLTALLFIVAGLLSYIFIIKQPDINTQDVKNLAINQNFYEQQNSFIEENTKIAEGIDFMQTNDSNVSFLNSKSRISALIKNVGSTLNNSDKNEITDIVKGDLNSKEDFPSPNFSKNLQFIDHNSNFKSNYDKYSKHLIRDVKRNNKLFKNRKRGILDDCFPVDIKTWLLEIYASPVYPQQFLAGDNSTLKQLRDKSENPWLSHSSGLRIGYNYKGGIVKTGVDYTSIIDKFEVTLKNVISTQVIITIDTIKNTDGTLTILRDTTIKEQYGEEKIKKYNKYRMIGIPLILGYELRYKNHSFGLNTGLIFNLYFNQSGNLMNENSKIIELSEMKDKIFAERIGATFYSGLTYSYSLSNYFSIFGEPRIAYNLFPITKSDYSINQKYLTYGISLGGRFLF
jgi:hypothetical protein